VRRRNLNDQQSWGENKETEGFDRERKISRLRLDEVHYVQAISSQPKRKDDQRAL
jgi:hypothetical protein